MMHSTPVRTVVLFCSLALVPPPGWCCLVARADVPRGSAKACCGCTHCRGAERQTSGPKPPPSKPFQCPCFDRHFAPPDVPSPSAAGVIVTSPSVAEALPAGVGIPCRDRVTARLADSPLYIVLCTFLC